MLYYPYFRGKQFELILLKEQVQLLKNTLFHPIIEPVKKDLRSLTRAVNHLVTSSVDFTLIINPQAGEKPVTQESLVNEFLKSTSFFKHFTVGFILSPETQLNDLVALLETYPDWNFSVIHRGFTDVRSFVSETERFDNVAQNIIIDGFAGKLYQKHLKKNGVKRILIRNGFKQQKRNSDYPPTEHFSDLHITYPDEGVDGFGDYLIAGDQYIESGGPAHAIAIHITYLSEDHDMNIFHFVSDQTDSPTNPAGKFIEALFKLVSKMKTMDQICWTNACKEYEELFEKQHYPGLGYLKKLSMQHHLELLQHYKDF